MVSQMVFSLLFLEGTMLKYNTKQKTNQYNTTVDIVLFVAQVVLYCVITIFSVT